MGPLRGPSEAPWGHLEHQLPKSKVRGLAIRSEGPLEAQASEASWSPVLVLKGLQQDTVARDSGYLRRDCVRNLGKLSSGEPPEGDLCLEQLSQRALHAWCPCSAEQGPEEAILCVCSRQTWAAQSQELQTIGRLVSAPKNCALDTYDHL